MTRPFFSRDRIAHFDIFERHADDAVAKMKQRAQGGYAIDLQVRLKSSLASIPNH